MVANAAVAVGRCQRIEFALPASSLTRFGWHALPLIKRISKVRGAMSARTASATLQIARRSILARRKSPDVNLTLESCSGLSDNHRRSSKGDVSRSYFVPHPISPVWAKSRHRRPTNLKSLAIVTDNPRPRKVVPTYVMGYTHDASIIITLPQFPQLWKEATCKDFCF